MKDPSSVRSAEAVVIVRALKFADLQMSSIPTPVCHILWTRGGHARIKVAPCENV